MAVVSRACSRLQRQRSQVCAGSRRIREAAPSFAAQIELAAVVAAHQVRMRQFSVRIRLRLVRMAGDQARSIGVDVTSVAVSERCSCSSRAR